MSILYLNDNYDYYKQPSWWINFLNVVHQEYSFDELSQADWQTVVHNAFYAWGAIVLMKDEDYSAISFDDESKATLFLLRWA